MRWILAVFAAILITGTAAAFDWWHEETPVWECVGIKGRAGYLECEETRKRSPRYGFEIENGLALIKLDGRMLFACDLKKPPTACRDYRIP